MSNIQIIEKGSQNLVTFSLDSKLLQSNIIKIDGCINHVIASEIQSQLLYLINTSSIKKISIYINSPGGNVYDGLSIYDMIEYAKSKGFVIETVCAGKAMSMGFILLISGSKGYRKSFKNSTILGHQVFGNANGYLPDIKIEYQEIERLNKILSDIIANNTKIEDPEKFFERDKYLTTNDCMELNIIDNII